MSANLQPEFTVVIPCYNEQAAIIPTLEQLAESLKGNEHYEILVVNDGSTDGTAQALNAASAGLTNVRILSHEQNRGYGAALKTGIRAASSEYIAIIDADGSYPTDRIREFVGLCKDYDMVVGARVGTDVTYSRVRSIPKYLLQKWVSWIAGQSVPDINSGLRAFRKSTVQDVFGVLSNRFSFTISLTLAMLTRNRPTLFVPISYKSRIGRSKIQPIRDTARFALIVLRTGTYFAPARAFTPIFGLLFIVGVACLVYDVFVLHDLTDKTLLMFLFSGNIAMFALLADMIDKRMG